MASQSDTFSLSFGERLFLALVVVIGGLLVLTVPLVGAAFWSLVSLVVTVFVLWLLWRLVQASKRIATATEQLALESARNDD